MSRYFLMLKSNDSFLCIFLNNNQYIYLYANVLGVIVLNTNALELYRLGEISLNEVLNQMSSNGNEKLSKEHPLNESTLELNNLIGLSNVKELIEEIKSFIFIQQKRKEQNLTSDPIVLHMIFKGNPGTGKTTVARIIGQIFKEMGLLKSGHMIEVDRSNIVGEYIGHTAVKVKKEVKRAIGGILFIDEAYSLARGSQKDFGKEAIDALVKSMEDHKDELILILAGYEDEMEIFLDSNPGLRSRFPIHIQFKDYTISELLDIANKIAYEKEYELSECAINKLKKLLSQDPDSKNKGNARFIRNIVERAFRKQAVRLSSKKHISKDDLLLIICDDIQGDGLY